MGRNPRLHNSHAVPLRRGEEIDGGPSTFVLNGRSISPRKPGDLR